MESAELAGELLRKIRETHPDEFKSYWGNDKTLPSKEQVIQSYLFFSDFLIKQFSKLLMSSAQNIIYSISKVLALLIARGHKFNSSEI